MNTDLNQLADVLEKTAAYIEATEAQKIAVDTEKRTKAANILAEQLTDVTGEHFDKEMVSKLAGLDTDVADVLSKLAGSGSVDSLGGPKEENTIKTASNAGVSPAEQRFMEYLTS